MNGTSPYRFIETVPERRFGSYSANSLYNSTQATTVKIKEP